MKKSKSLLRKQIPMPLWQMIILDFAIFAAALLIFAYFHHVRSYADTRTDYVSTMVEQDTVSEAGTGSVEGETAAEVSEIAAVSEEPAEKFGDKFTTGDVIADDNSYKSQNICITIEDLDDYNGSHIVFADIYVRDITSFGTALADETFGRNVKEKLTDIATRHKAVIAINGDYYSIRSKGLVIRDGILYRDSVSNDRDVCVIYQDGTMETFLAGTFDLETESAKGIYQAWNFGPQLIDENGQASTSFNANDDVRKIAPRTAIGYYEPGHYCFVVVDGRSDDSDGFYLDQLAQFMYSRGCKKAYNMDGGGTSQFILNGEIYNQASRDRKSSDIIMITDGPDPYKKTTISWGGSAAADTSDTAEGGDAQ